MNSMNDAINVIQVGGTGGFEIFIATFLFVILAEMGDKSQLLVMAFAAKYKFRQVFIGITLSIILLNTLAVVMGSIVTTIIPMVYIQIIASIAFIIFGILSFRNDEDEEEAKNRAMKLGPTLAIATSFFVAELGDRTQLATMTLAAKYNAPFQVLAGAVIAMIIADMLGIVAGVAVNKYIPQRYIKIASGLIFIGFGVTGLLSLVPNGYLSGFMDSTAAIIGVLALLIIVALMLGSKGKKIKE